VRSSSESEGVESDDTKDTFTEVDASKLRHETLDDYPIYQIFLTLAVQSSFPVFFTLSLYFDNHFILLWVLFVGFPVLDLILPRDTWNPTPSQAKLLEKDSRFLLPLYFTFFSDLAIYLYSLNLVIKDESFQAPMRFCMLALMTAQSSAANVAVGHELYHRRSWVHKVFGLLGYAKFYYSHFCPSHVKYHHKTVATPEDPVTARMNESVNEYFARCIPGKVLEVWNIGASKRGHWLTWKNIMLRHIALSLAIVIAIQLTFGFKAVIFSIVSSIMCMLMIETVNYVEHYGLLRKKDEKGVYEPVNIKHSWNAPQVITNYMLFKLQRHSDHHANVYKPY
jgi:alkane 1-monooxygenase